MRSGATRLLSGRSCQRLFSSAAKDAVPGTSTNTNLKPGTAAGGGTQPAAAGAGAQSAAAGSSTPSAKAANAAGKGPASASAAAGRAPLGSTASVAGAAPGRGTPSAVPPLTAPGPGTSAATSNPIGSSSVGSSSIAGSGAATAGGSSSSSGGGGTGGRRLLVPFLMFAGPLGAYWVYDQYLNGLFGPGPVIGGGGKVFDAKFMGKGGGKGSGGSGGAGGIGAAEQQREEAGADGSGESFSMRTLAPGEAEAEEQETSMQETDDATAAPGSQQKDPAGSSDGAAAGSHAGVHDYSAASDEFPGAVPIDTSPVMDLLNDVLLGSSYGDAAAVGRADEPPHQQTVEQAAADQTVSAVKAAHAADEAKTSSSDGTRAHSSSDTQGAQQQQQDKQQQQQQDKQQQQQAPTTDAAAPTAASSSTAGRASTAGAGALPPPGALPAPSATGFKQDLTPGGLVSRAMEGGLGAEGDWGSYGAQLRQATSDAATFREALEQVRNNYQARLDSANASAEHATTALREAREQAESLSQRYQQLMQEQARLAQEVTKAEVRRAEERVLAATADHAVQERKERLKSLDDVRMQLNTLSKAFQHRSDQARSSTETHRVSLGILALEQALETGKPFERQLQALREGCSDDPLLQAALDALPAQAARQGLPTARELEQQFANVKQQAKELSYFPAGSGGMVAHLVAKLAAKLKVDEAPAAGAITPETAAAAPMAAAQAALASGKLQEAASAVEAATVGTGAQSVSAAWVENARKRALTEQTVQLLRAHAAATASSLA